MLHFLYTYGFYVSSKYTLDANKRVAANIIIKVVKETAINILCPTINIYFLVTE